MVLDAFLLSNIEYESKVSRAIQRKELHPPLHLGTGAIEKGTFGRPWLRAINLYIYVYMYIYI